MVRFWTDRLVLLVVIVIKQGWPSGRMAAFGSQGCKFKSIDDYFFFL